MTIVAAMAVGVLAGCQTTGTTAEGINPDEAAMVRELFGTSCVITKTRGQSEKSRQLMMAETSIMSITDRQDGWRAADVAYRGFRGNFYYNQQTAQVTCGTKNWRKFQDGEYDPPVHPILKGTSGETAGAKVETRPIAVKWEGQDELISGQVYMSQNGQAGAVAIVMPDNQGKCTGRYDAKDRSTGTWRIKCTNGLEAHGEYTAYGDGKGASGVGTDQDGRKVTYTIGGRNT